MRNLININNSKVILQSLTKFISNGFNCSFGNVQITLGPTPTPTPTIDLQIIACLDCASVPTASPWDGGTIYNVGALVTYDGKTWRCLHYAPAGAGPFGGYLDGTAPGHNGITYWEEVV